MSDYKKHKIKPGVYTMRLAYQPMDGDHMGTAPFAEFSYPRTGEISTRESRRWSGDAAQTRQPGQRHGHPAVFLLFPVAKKDLGKPPAVAKRENNHWVLTVTQDVTVEGKKTTIGIGLALIGVSPSA